MSDTTTTVGNDPTKTVATPSSPVRSMYDFFDTTRALMGGTATMRLAGNKFLPKWPNEDEDSYRFRLQTSTLFPAYSRTINTLASKPFSKPVTLSDDMPSEVKDWMEHDCDLQGRNLHVFAACVLESALAHGHCGILVDYPTVDTTVVRTQADEAALGLRPYLVHIEPWNILGWRDTRINGVQTLTQLRMREFVDEPSGEWGEDTIEQVRVLEPGKWRTYRKNDKGDWIQHAEGVTTLDFIPFTVVYAERTDFMTSKPPLMEMAHLNVKHWQSQSDQDNLLHVVRVPILTVSGIDDDTFQLTVGAQAAVKLPPGGAVSYAEHSGSALGAGRQSLEDLKEEMRQSGAELLVLQPGRITATQVATENAVGMCALQRITEATEDALNSVLKHVAAWRKQPVDAAGTVVLFKDFGAATLAEASAQLVVMMQQAGIITKATVINEAKRRGILSADLDTDDEVEAAAAEGPALGAMGMPGTGGPAGAAGGGGGGGKKPDGETGDGSMETTGGGGGVND